MFDGKLKAITFSYDDGVTQDRRLVDIFNKYGLKCTFNLNSGGLSKVGDPYITPSGKKVLRDRVDADEVISLYNGHEVAVHTLTHPNLTTRDEKEIIHQVEDDRLNLSKLCGYEVVGMAYPCGGINNDERVANIIRKHTGVKYSRTITSSYSFDEQQNLIQFNPTVYHREYDKMLELAEKFINLTTDKPQIFYIWGHSYEFDIDDSWDKFENFCKLISGKNDIFYGTNSQILLR